MGSMVSRGVFSFFFFLGWGGVWEMDVEELG